jgi:hypothetical protein
MAITTWCHRLMYVFKIFLLMKANVSRPNPHRNTKHIDHGLVQNLYLIVINRSNGPTRYTFFPLYVDQLQSTCCTLCWSNFYTICYISQYLRVDKEFIPWSIMTQDMSLSWYWPGANLEFFSYKLYLKILIVHGLTHKLEQNFIWVPHKNSIFIYYSLSYYSSFKIDYIDANT